MSQFTDHKFKSDNDPTIGVEFGSRSQTILDKQLKLQIWDTAGQESFRSITRSYFRGAIGALLVFDITNKETFENLGNWVDETQMCASGNIVMVLVGNKSDLTASREVSLEEAMEFANKKGLTYVETSAKTSSNVQKSFEMVAEIVLDRIEKGFIDPKNEGGIKIGAQELGGVTLNSGNTVGPTTSYGCNSC